MLTRSELKFGEGSFEEYIHEIGSWRAFRKQEMASKKDRDSSNPNPFDTKEALFSVFMAIKAMMEEMYEDQKKAKGTGGKGKEKLHNFRKQSKKQHNFEKQSKGKEEEKTTCSH
jgi:hypothetical protein